MMRAVLSIVAPLTLPAVALVALVAVVGCEGERMGERNFVVERDGKKHADVNEIVRANRVRGELLQRRYVLVDEPKDAVLMLASLDGQGFATGASYRREGPKGKRYVELTWEPREGPDRRRVLFSRGDDEVLALPDKPVVILGLEERLHAQPNQDVLLLDLENAVPRMARINERGQLVMPSAPPPVSAQDAVVPAHKERAPFLESKTELVATWCRAQGMGETPLAAAKKVALAVKPKVSAERAGGPPSALMTVQVGGGDEGGAALVVACMRALGHPGRVVTGTVGAGEGDAATTSAVRTWAQVHDGTAWIDVDAMDIDLDGKQALVHNARIEGFRGPLTTGLLAR
jgi:hypothetical protein